MTRETVSGKRHRSLIAAIVPRVLGAVYYLSLLLFCLSVGGLIHLSCMETPAPRSGDAVQLRTVSALVLAIGVLAVASAWTLLRRNRKTFLFGTTLFCIAVPLTLCLGELLARAFVPSWPAIGLHGVDPRTGPQAWGKVGSSGIEGNAWGQRDRSRAVEPPSGCYRIAFVGDSFLEESAALPVSVEVERKINSDRVEVVNLGVSASSPDEYYYRTKNIALPLGAKHVVFFVFAGNDFVEPVRTLTSFCGIVAVYPRGSLLSTLGLRGLNHLFTNRARPVIQAWFGAGDLRSREEYLGAILVQSDDATARKHLLNAGRISREQHSCLARRLERPEMGPFLDMLRHPDDGLFRSYYLSTGLWSASVDGGQWSENSEVHAYAWVEKTYRLCQKKNVRFTLVIVPEAFQVDSRMYEQWKPLCDMRHLTKPCRDAALRLAERADDEGIHVIDLHLSLQDLPGTYLNLDGHWSDKGVDVVSDVLAAELDNRLPP